MKYLDRVRSFVAPSCSDTSGMVLAVGGLLSGGAATVTVNDCEAVSLPFRAVAVTVTVALPGPSGVTVKVVPSTDTVATAFLLEVAE